MEEQTQTIGAESPEIAINATLSQPYSESAAGGEMPDTEAPAEARASQTQAEATDENQTQQPQKPRTVEDYQVNLPEGEPVNPALQSRAREMAAAQGLSQEQFDAFVDFYMGSLDDARKAAETARAEWGEQLARQWGDKYEANFSLADKAAKRYGGDPFVQVMNTSGLSQHPAVMNFLAQVGAAISESAMVPGDKAQVRSVQRTAEGRPILDFPSMREMG